LKTNTTTINNILKGLS